MLVLKPPVASLASFAQAKSSNMPRKINAAAASGFGNRLATLRKAAGITQTAFAAEIEKLDAGERRQVLQVLDAYIERGQ